MDIDHFKRVNDRYGHLYGDEVLLLFARLMGNCFRYTDFLFRFGGEEFVALLTYADETGAHTALERFRTTVQAYDFPRVEHITVSIGYCGIDDDSLAPSLIDMADRALYHAKHHGRNRVVAFGETEGHPSAAEATEVEYF
jgi:diguanylate cyclase (GGDEF)-like protein